MTSGLCSVTCASTAVRVGWICFEIVPRTAVDVEQRSDERPVRAAEEHPDRAADDADEQADRAAARGADVGVVADLGLHVDATVGVARDDGGVRDPDLVLRIELLEVGERL